ncbi:glycoside hydrolase family 16 protein [Mycena pura]|uniref:Glycoside hydrolase family 16 protein n=1 Tax=Mycena pura TaxID=153505 RepID=A0AAD6VCR9_9AGAR|nr:glycoside hydrolase family 16 protein [Mycena pura]
MKSAILTLSFAVSSAFGALYLRSESIVGTDFFHSFDWMAIDDPTHGRVNYTDEVTAKRANLTFASHNKFILRADDTTVLAPDGPGRNSVRLSSKHNYTTHVAVFDIAHMPQGCGTWPAVYDVSPSVVNWEFGGNWPVDGEVDILEGANDQGTDQATLHTGPNCTMPAVRCETGTALQSDCDANVNFNEGCGVSFNETTSYGPTFNTNGGGWYAMERTKRFIAVWFWARNDYRVPREVVEGEFIISTSRWGTPAAYFPNTSCDLADWAPHNIIINLTLCGDFAGNPAVYASSGCPSTCVDYVNNNATVFSDAFFEFNSINVYTHTGLSFPFDG